ncbi:hypothetical protein U1Q18_046806, partial [Sarracenia purpurea var. burkii]
EEEGNAPRSSAGPMKRVLLRQREVKRRPAGDSDPGKQVEGEEEEQGGDYENEFDLIKEAFEVGFVVQVTGEADEHGKDEEEEAQVKRKGMLG